MTGAAPALLVFAKEPVAGAVKTRLARTIGPERAMRVYSDLLATTLAHAHAAGVQISGTGITLTAALAKAHASGAPVTDNAPTPGAPNSSYRKTH